MNKLFKIPLLLSYLLFYALIAFGYSAFVYPTYAYFGFPYEPNYSKLFEAIAFLILLVVVSPSKLKKPSDFFIHLQIIFVVVPMLVLYYIGDMPKEYTFISFISVLITIILPKFKFPSVNPFLVKVRHKIFINIIIAISFVTAAAVISINGLSFNLNLYDVYEYRRAASASLPSIFAFLTPVVASVFLPLLIVISLEFKKIRLWCFSVILCVVMFATLHHKSYLFYPVVISGLFWLLRQRKSLLKLVMSINLLLLLSIACNFLFESKSLIDLILRRMLVVPAFLNYTYFDFFSNNPKVYLSNSKMALGLFDYPYSRKVTNVIGEYLGFPDMSANTGWLGTGYMHFGFVGLIVFGIIVGILIKILDLASRKNGNSLVTALIAYTPYSKLFSSTDLPTAFLTHGLIYTLIILFLVKFDKSPRVLKEVFNRSFIYNIIR